MATVLLGWELGGGLGHVGGLLEVAGRLAAHGHAPVLALKDLVEPLPILAGVPYPVVQTPTWPGGAPEGFVAASYADILAIRGYDHADGLEAMVSAWRRLIDLTGATLVVGDAAPTLILAALGETPAVLVESGFHAPPADADAFPTLNAGRSPTAPAGALLAAVREVQRRRGRPLPETLPGIFAEARRFVRTFPELDPYRAARRTTADGPLRRLPAPASPKPGPRPAFFAYLAAEYPGVDLLLPRLAEAGHRVGAFLRNASPALVGACREAGVVMHAAPRPLAEELAESTVVIHHGSLGTAEAALAAGRPQLALPRHSEHEHTGRAIEGLGVGISLAGRLELRDVEHAAGRLVREPAFAERAMAMALELRSREPGECLSRVTDCCLGLL